MSKIASAFSGANDVTGTTAKKTFIGFLTAGDPSLDKTAEYILTMAAAGADLIEIGIPFSDPIAEGAVIQAANERALAGGTTPDKIFAMVERVREKVSVPLVFLTYLNPLLNYGYEKFCSRAARAGIDGLIIPDLPFEERNEILPAATKNNIDLISLIAPTSQARIEKIATAASGFIYVVSSLGVTGVRQEIKTDLEAIIGVIKKCTSAPVAVGFGINTPDQAREIARYADGVIVGSAIVRIIAEHGDHAAAPLANYVATMKRAIS